MIPQPELLTDELDLIRRVLPGPGADVLDPGYGEGKLLRRLAQEGIRVVGVEVDGAAVAGAGEDIRIYEGRAEDLPFEDASFDLILMLKSLHHVAVAAMPQAFVELARVLRPSGLLYCWEPVFAGPFNDIVRLFHDEQAERRAALNALHDAAAEGAFELIDERLYRTEVSFQDFDDFARRMFHLPTLTRPVKGQVLLDVHAAWQRIGVPLDGKFQRLMRLTLLRRAQSTI